MKFYKYNGYFIWEHESFQALLIQLWQTIDGTQKDYNGLESTTYLHLQLNLNIKA